MSPQNEIDANQLFQKETTEARDPLRDLLRRVVEALMSAEADAVCGARWGERRRDRINSRNGYRARTWDTEVGTIDLAIPKLRRGTYFPSWLLEPRRSAERTLTAVVVEAYVRGVSTRKVAALVQSLGIERLSKNQLWKLTREMDGAIRSLRPPRAGHEADKLTPAPAPAWTGPPRTLDRG